jgi:DNA-binding NtrC family response regulator
MIGGVRSCSRLVARSEAMRTLLSKVAIVAGSDAPVVIEGESGTGKEVLARTIHANSPRAEGAFVAVNVAALPADLLESELFGHARGAFTGATAPKPGLFETAAGGTLFLDEIGEMPHAPQVKLLRALQDGEIRRVGETRAFSVDVRILCATNADLRADLASARFRSDLYYRLRVFSFVVPPLRERREDILPLAHVLLERTRHASRRFTPAAEHALETYAWPGNVRELGNAVQHGAILSRNADIDVVHLPDDVASMTVQPTLARFDTLAVVERTHVLRVLESCRGNQAAAARILGIARTTLWRKMRELELASAVGEPLLHGG